MRHARTVDAETTTEILISLAVGFLEDAPDKPLPNFVREMAKELEKQSYRLARYERWLAGDVHTLSKNPAYRQWREQHAYWQERKTRSLMKAPWQKTRRKRKHDLRETERDWYEKEIRT
jgi:hypothetical protein